MKIINWNSNCAFRKKFDSIAEYNPDIVVVPESESPNNLKKCNARLGCKSHVWCGDADYKGLSVMTFNGYKAQIADFYNDNFKFVLPVEVWRKSRRFLVIAVWTKFVGTFRNAYIAQACQAMEYYKNYIDKNTIIIGDFNSNKLWDRSMRRRENHSCLLRILGCLGFASVYHRFYGEEQGAETRPTIFLYRKPEKQFHIDYVFMHESRLRRINDFYIGEYEDWIRYSDHMPMFMEVR